jgi:hypothetical protein
VPQPDAYVGDELGDAACTQRVYTEAPTSCAPTTPALRHLAVDYAHGQLFDVAAPREGSVYRLVNGTCQLSRTATVYDLTPASLATFDELTLSEESCHPTLGTCSETCSGDATCNGGFCSASVCLAKIANNQPLPSELGACGPDVAKRACMSGACSADGKCGVARGGACTKNDECREDPCFQGKCQRPPSSSSSSSGGATAGDDDDDSSAPEKPSASSGSSAPPLPHPSPQTATPDAPGCSTSPRPTGWPVGTFALVALVLYVSCRRHTR